MSTTDASSDAPDPRDDPAAVIREELGDHRDALEAIADLDFGNLSEDARTALEILSQEDDSS